MSDLPNGWQLVRLGELCEWASGGTPRRSEPSYFGGEYPWITISDLNDGVVTRTTESLTKAGVEGSAAKLVPERTVLVALYGSIGKLGITTQPSTTNQAIACALPDEAAFDPLYLFHFLRSRRRGLAMQGTGVTQKNIYLGDIKAFSAPVAPRAEQSRIVAKLEELLSDLDAGVAELKAAQKKLQQYRQSLLKAAVEGALTAPWREAQRKLGTPTETGAQLLQRILTERRARWEAKQLAKFKEQGKAPPKDWHQKYPEPVAPDTTGLPALPNGWAWASAEQLCDFITKGTTPPKELDDGRSREVPFLRVTNLTDTGALDFSDQVFVADITHRGFLARSVVLPGDVLMNIVGPPLGQVSLVPSDYPEWNINQAIAIFRTVPGVLNSFLGSWLLSVIANRWLKSRAKTTAGQSNLTLELCRALPVPLPPQIEQAAIHELVSAVLKAADEQQSAIALSLRQSTAQRQNILRAAFAGQLVPQDPNDEPASVLLERIRAERDARATQQKPRARQARVPA